ncbi:relaxin-3 receptor 2 [Xenopus tropicalis]|uniref:Relaxin-3 receptor 2 n=2 Tax=Xenopus tropicalis TaxID=8364 RepID=A0A8J1IQ37_XENTR|nr:relaxin-3 receptor 2 [Xenopus tropicalis]
MVVIEGGAVGISAKAPSALPTPYVGPRQTHITQELSALSSEQQSEPGRRQQHIGARQSHGKGQHVHLSEPPLRGLAIQPWGDEDDGGFLTTPTGHYLLQRGGRGTYLWWISLGEMDHNVTMQIPGFPLGNTSMGIEGLSEDDNASLPMDGLKCFQILVATIYSLVCALGLMGNFFVMYLIRAKRATGLTAIDVFIFCLALTDFQFALTMPFWAVDALLDFSWPFGHPMCKIVLTMTVLNVYVTVFLLTAMAITRYWAVASALSLRGRVSTSAAKGISLALWLVALVATIPTTIFATTFPVLGEELCLLKFPENKWLATYHLQRVIVGFVIPFLLISTSYIMLLSFLRQHKVNANNRDRQSRINNSVQLVIMVFFICWFPNHAATFWGILIKYRAVQWSDAFYFFHTYVFPVTLCLAHSNSCLNPIIYCLMRKEFRKALKASFWQLYSFAASFWPSWSPKRTTSDQETMVPLYRETSLPNVGSRDYAVTSVCTITTIQEFTTKDQSHQNTGQRRQDTATV